MNRRIRRSPGVPKLNRAPRPIRAAPRRPRRSAAPEILLILAAFGGFLLADYLLRSSSSGREAPPTSYVQHDKGPDAPDRGTD